MANKVKILLIVLKLLSWIIGTALAFIGIIQKNNGLLILGLGLFINGFIIQKVGFMKVEENSELYGYMDKDKENKE